MKLTICKPSKLAKNLYWGVLKKKKGGICTNILLIHIHNQTYTYVCMIVHLCYPIKYLKYNIIGKVYMFQIILKRDHNGHKVLPSDRLIHSFILPVYIPYQLYYFLNRLQGTKAVQNDHWVGSTSVLILYILHIWYHITFLKYYMVTKVPYQSYYFR